MGFQIKTADQIRDGMLRDISNQNPQAAIGSDSDFRLRSNATAAAIEGLYQHQAWIARQMMIDTADDDIVLQRASLYGMSQKAANAAVGSIVFSGAVGAQIGTGVEAKTLDGQAYVTTTSGVIQANGTVALNAVASTPGAAGNQIANTAVTLTSAPAGIATAAQIVSMMSGTDQETVSALASRVLDRMRHPPAGGNKYDYRRWALEVPGVSTAWCFPLRRGPGTADVAILSNGAQAAQLLCNTVKSYIESQNPAGGECLVVTPVAVPINVTATVSVATGVALADVQAVVQTVLGAYIFGLQPGDAVLRSRILASITDVPGVTDVNLTSPAATVQTVVNAAQVQLAILGTVQLS